MIMMIIENNKTNNQAQGIPEMTLMDYMCQEEREEKDQQNDNN